MDTRRVTPLTLIVFSALRALSGCSTDTIPIDEFPAALERALCERAVACGGAIDQAGCESAAFVAENRGVLTTVASVKRGALKYDAGKASDCLRELDEGGCADLPHDSPNCDAIFTGTVAVGGACFGSLECATDGRCEAPAGCTAACCVGTCRARPTRGPAGAGCTTDSECLDGTFCGSSAVCVPDLAAGAACQGHGCASPAVCLRAPDGSSEVCTVISSEPGASCIPDANYGCGRSDETCDATTRKCTKRAMPGGACQENAGCVGYANCVAGICKTRPTLGEPCDYDAGIYCQVELICPAGVCAAPATQPACTI